ncbi:hypothetical protein G7Y89_g4334 [Cudoniella acicularis]|uniref:Heterokaryon incompatibility domain-containing protein n=1 Tax=Cudoniella acicularis TaxID=354080 RepID=A0A8H4RPP8_9HELO|nr:hypothetical protein G7Y89_g4334 [Cudoniella acicularis]
MACSKPHNAGLQNFDSEKRFNDIKHPITTSSGHVQLNFQVMESTICLSLRFRVFQATSKLYADFLGPQASHHLQWALFHHFCILPRVVATANSHYLVLLELLGPIHTLYVERSDWKNAIRKAADYTITIILWAIICTTLHRETSPLKVSLFINSLNWLFSNPISGLFYSLPVLYAAFTTVDWRPIPVDRKPQDAQLYQYEKLYREDSIRLLLLYPRHPRGPVECTLFQTPISTAPSYEAISYCWGTGGTSGVILVNGKKASVTSNANQVLKNLSTEEKEKQVQMMHRIYKSAFRVSVCLVQESQAQLLKDSSSHNGFRRWIDERSTAWEEDLANYTIAFIARNLLEDFRISDLHETDDGDAMYRRFGRRSRTLHYESLRSLFANPWFDRIWVVQEVALA